MQQATQLLGLKNVAVLYGNDDDFTLSGYDVFIQALGDNNVNVVDEETFSKGDVDFSAQLTSLLSNNPDALVVSALAAEAVQIINQARQQGYTGRSSAATASTPRRCSTRRATTPKGLIVGGAWNSGNPNPSDSSVAVPAGVPGGQRRQQPRPVRGAGLYRRVADGDGDPLRRLDRSRRRSTTALGNIKDMETPLGSFSFDANGEPSTNPSRRSSRAASSSRWRRRWRCGSSQ